MLICREGRSLAPPPVRTTFWTKVGVPKGYMWDIRDGCRVGGEVGGDFFDDDDDDGEGGKGKRGRSPTIGNQQSRRDGFKRFWDAG